MIFYLLAMAAAMAGTVLARPTVAPQPFSFFVNNTILTTSGGFSASYPRYTELDDGTILATTAGGGGTSPGTFPIFESKDGGASWKHISDLHDTQFNIGFFAQPALTYLPFALGKWPNGTILAGGNIFGSTFTSIELYASTDGARTWQFVAHVAQGGRPDTTNGATPVWEPTFLGWNNSVIAYYSDQRDPKHGQKLSHQVSTDLVHWGPVVTDVAHDLYIARPGMTNIAYIAPLAKWILVHEFPVGNQSSYGANYPVYYVLANTPDTFGNNTDTPLVVNGTLAPNASPYVAWTPVGGPLGTIVVSDADNMGVFTNRKGGDPAAWELHATPAGAVYSRAVEILRGKPDHLLIYGGDTYNGAAAHAHVPFSATSLNITQVLTQPAYGYKA
jgi:hypothetical protein